MATRSMSGLLVAAMVGALPACNAEVTGGGKSGDPGTSTTTTTTTTTTTPAEGTAYPGKGFIVHEWGTDTVVVGSDGSLQRGLHHEEEDLPGFVYDRLSTTSATGELSVEVKMETPVTYFYSDVPRTVNATVGFPKGVFTQWYPSSMHFFPPVAGVGAKLGVDAVTDPVFDLDFPFDTPECAKKYGSVADGVLDWGAVDVLARDAKPSMEEAPLDKYTWSYARQVASNPVRILGVPDESEKFLFYRGLGNFDLPVTVSAQPNGKLVLHNGYSEPIGRVFVIRVEGGNGGVDVLEGGIVAGGSVEAVAPDAHAMPIDALVERLSTELTKTLDGSGLYHDEAVAMVSTWKRQWFKTPGLRLLYLIPQAWTDASIPLTIAPEPDESVRVMMIRAEVITPELEDVDVAAAKKLADAGTKAEAMAHFESLGRFAEPRLRRALQILGAPSYADEFLAAIETAETRQAAGE